MRGLGLMLLLAAGALTVLLMRSPLGALSFAPDTWKGAPMTLAAAFCGVYGALLLFVRRFSLASMVAAMLVAACFSVGTQAYVRNLHEVETVDLDFILPDDQTEAFLNLTKDSVTESRLTDFAEDLYTSGVLPEAPAFDQVQVVAGRPEGGRGQQVSVTFLYCPFIHPRSSLTRDVAMRYAMLICERNIAKLSSSWEASGVWNRFRMLRRWAHDYHMQHSTGKSPSEFADRFALARWLVKREPDAALRAFLHAQLEAEIQAEQNTP